MTPEKWDRLKAIFEDVMQVSAEERAEFLARACDGDPAMRAELETLIDKAESTTGFLETEHRQRILISLKKIAPIFAPGDVISGRYRVLRFIAEGGMGEVYEVEDAELGTRVALKTVNLAVAENPDLLNRFKREIQLARKVTHPNVCRVYDVGHHDHRVHSDIPFLTMELLRGATLAQYLKREGPLTCRQSLPLIHQMISALSAAHHEGIIHRDFKPGNVIAVDSRVPLFLKVTDFGLARSLRADETHQTSHGQIMGTPDYMAPEQFGGDSGPETDIYALGLVIFEMLIGRLPTSRETPFKEVEESSIRPPNDMDTRWQGVITKCLATDREGRFREVDAVWHALSGGKSSKRLNLPLLYSARIRHKAVYISILSLVMFLILLAWVNVISNPFIHLPQQKHIAVLPFQNIGNDGADQAFTDGVVESLTSKLSSLERYENSLWIVPSSDSRQIKSLDEAYRTMHVTLAITGSIQHTGKGVILTANLVDAKNHKQLASRSVHATSDDLEGLQDRVWRSVADMIDLQVSPEMARTVNAGGTKQPGAFELYEQGLGYSQRYDVDNVDRAIDLFMKALSKDPEYALAYAELGGAYAAKYAVTKDRQWIQLAISNSHRALELNDSLAPVHVTLGWIYQQSGEFDKALAQFQHALDEDPAAIKAVFHIGEIYAAQGKLEEAEEAFKSVINRRPGYWLGYSGLGTFYYNHGKFAQAAAQFQAMIDLQPDNPLGYDDLGGTYIAMARYDDAINTLKKELALKETSTAWTNLGSAYMYLGKYPDAVNAMKRATEIDPHYDVLWRNLGDGYRQMPSGAGHAASAYQNALRTATEELAVNPNDAEVLSGVALYHAHLGQRGDAEAFLAKALRLAPRDSDILFTSALIYEIIGNRDNALTAIDHAVKAGYSLEYVEREPELRDLRSDVRYKKWWQQTTRLANVTHSESLAGVK